MKLPKPKRHPIQTARLEEYPSLLKHEFQEGDVVVLNKGRGHEMRVLKDLIRRLRGVWRRINKDRGINRKTRFNDSTRKELWREYHLIVDNKGVVIGRSPLFGLPIASIANVCYLVGGSGFSNLDYKYDVCFVNVEYDEARNLHNKVCIVWTLWGRAIAKDYSGDVSGNS